MSVSTVTTLCDSASPPPFSTTSSLLPAKGTWNVAPTSGALVQGGYGHSSVFHPGTRAIYIHGGYKAFSANKYGLAGDLYRLDVDTRKW